MEELNHVNWPVLSRYDQEHSGRIALPLGGIGTHFLFVGMSSGAYVEIRTVDPEGHRVGPKW